MERNHTYMSRQNFSDISHYSELALDKLERGAGELPQWVNHLISTSRAHMQDVGHYLREEARKGRRFGGMHSNTELIPGGLASGMNLRHFDPVQLRVGTRVEMEHTNDPRIAREIAADHIAEHPHGYYEGLAQMESRLEKSGRRFAGHAPAAYMARKNLREISEYADASNGLLEQDGGIFPAWVEHKLSLVAQNMDTVGHFLENENMEGRKYGSREFIPFPGEAGDAAYYYGIADGMGGQHRPDRWGSQIPVYEQGWREGNQKKNKTDSQPMRAHYYGMADALAGNDNSGRWAKTPYLEIYKSAFAEIQGRRYGARGGAGGGAGRGGGARGGPRGGARGGGGRPAGSARPGVPGMGGRGRHFRRHRHRNKHPSYVYPAWGYPYHPWWGHLGYYPAPLYVEEQYPVPIIRHVYAHRVKRQLLPEIPDSFGVIGMTGSGFNNVPDNSLVIRYRLGTGAWREDKAVVLSRDDGNMEVAIPVSNKVLSGFALGDIGYVVDGELISMGGTFFNSVPRPWNPFVKRRRFGVAGGKRRLYAATDKPRPSGTKPIPTTARPVPTAPPPSMHADPIPTPTFHGEPIPGHPGELPPPETVFPFETPPPLRPLQASKMMQMFPPNRMLEDNRMGIWHRMEGEPTGRQFGTPPPGWIGQGGVSQVPLAVARGGGRGPMAAPTYGSLGYASMGDGSMDLAVTGGGRRFAGDRTFGPGLNAGQAGVETLGGKSGPIGRGPMAVQTYGSLGYASMGDGSMDKAVQGAMGRTFAQTNSRGRDLSRSHKKRRRLQREGRW